MPSARLTSSAKGEKAPASGLAEPARNCGSKAPVGQGEPFGPEVIWTLSLELTGARLDG